VCDSSGNSTPWRLVKYRQEAGIDDHRCLRSSGKREVIRAIRRVELTRALASAGDVLGARWSNRIQGLSLNLVGFVAVLQPSSDVSARVHAEYDVQTIVLLSLSSMWAVQQDSRHVTAGPRIKTLRRRQETCQSAQYTVPFMSPQSKGRWM
jgi:hypothetical protein